MACYIAMALIMIYYIFPETVSYVHILDSNIYRLILRVSYSQPANDKKKGMAWAIGQSALCVGITLNERTFYSVDMETNVTDGHGFRVVYREQG